MKNKKKAEPNIGDIVYCDRTDKPPPRLPPFYGYVDSYSHSYPITYNVIPFVPVDYGDDLRMLNRSFISIRIPPAWFQDGSAVVVSE